MKISRYRHRILLIKYRIFVGVLVRPKAITRV
jgi:hypothetical protein